MALRVQLVPAEVQALQRELQAHPDLAARVQANANTFEDCLAMLADHFDIVMHGDYTEAEVNRFCQILVNKLQDSRKVIITSAADSRMQS